MQGAALFYLIESSLKNEMICFNSLKYLILGARGMAGHTISIYLNEKGHDVTGFARKKLLHCNTVIGDATDEMRLYNIIKEGKFDAVINCIGILNQFADQNKKLAVYLNAYLPHFLAEVTQNISTQIIHLSTDCVFSGKRGNYTEDDFPDGETFYDRSKALGELIDNKNITFRNSIVGPDINENGIGLFNWFMKQNGSIRGYTNVYWTGLTTLQLAKTIEYAAQVKANGSHNMVNNQSISKYNLLQLFNKFLKDNIVEIIPDDELVVNKSLKRTRFDLDFLVPDYEKMIFEMSLWIKSHKNYYPHYFL